MPLNTANNVEHRRLLPRRIVFVVFPRVKLLDLAGPLQVFADASPMIPREAGYETFVTSLEGRDITSDTGLSIKTTSLDHVTGRPIDTLLVCGGGGAEIAAQNVELTSRVKDLARRSRRVGSICTGAFVLAAAGLLDRKRAVTHWESCARLAEAFPSVQVEPDPIFIEDGSVWTSAGVTAGIDLALAMIAADQGREVSLDVARSLVAFMVRPGGQSQFSAALSGQIKDTEGRFDGLHRWISQNLSRDLRVEALAERMNMSLRTFARLYVRHTHTTPAKAVESLRVEAARNLLETTDMAVSRIAKRCGFGDDERMRCAFNRILRVSPTEYRLRFNG